MHEAISERKIQPFRVREKKVCHWGSNKTLRNNTQIYSPLKIRINSQIKSRLKEDIKSQIQGIKRKSIKGIWRQSDRRSESSAKVKSNERIEICKERSEFFLRCPIGPRLAQT